MRYTIGPIRLATAFGPVDLPCRKGQFGERQDACMAVIAEWDSVVE